MAGDGGRADVEGDAEQRAVRARPQRDHFRQRDILMDCGGHGPVAAPQRGLHLPEQDRVERQPAPFTGRLDRRKQPVGVAERAFHVRLRHPHRHQPRRRIDGDRAGFGALAHHLPVDRELGRHVDHEVAEHAGGAGQSAAVGQHAASAIGSFGLDGFGQVAGAAGDAVLGEFALGHFDLAAPAQAAAAADALDIDAEMPRRVEQRRAERKPPAPAARHEQHQCVVLHRLDRGHRHHLVHQLSSRPPEIASASSRA